MLERVGCPQGAKPVNSYIGHLQFRIERNPPNDQEPDERTGKCRAPRASLRLALPILAGTPRNAPMPADAGSFERERAGSPLRRSRSDSGSGHSLRSETPWFQRSRTPLAIRRPSTTIRQDRSRSQALVATPAALPRFHLRRLLPPLTACRLHSAPAPARRTRLLESVGAG